MPSLRSDRGEEALREVLGRHTNRFHPAPIELTAKNTFDSDWKASLEDRSRETFQSDIRMRSKPESKNGLSRTLKEERLRRILSELLLATAPEFSAPLYIGKSKKVGTRVRKHVKMYREMKTLINADPQKLQALERKLKEQDLHFAARALNLGFTEDHLIVSVAPIQAFAPEGTSRDDLEGVADSAELFLNRWHRPYLGIS